MWGIQSHSLALKLAPKSSRSFRQYRPTTMDCKNLWSNTMQTIHSFVGSIGQYSMAFTYNPQNRQFSTAASDLPPRPRRNRSAVRWQEAQKNKKREARGRSFKKPVAEVGYSALAMERGMSEKEALKLAKQLAPKPFKGKTAIYYANSEAHPYPEITEENLHLMPMPNTIKSVRSVIIDSEPSETLISPTRPSIKGSTDPRDISRVHLRDPSERAINAVVDLIHNVTSKNNILLDNGQISPDHQIHHEDGEIHGSISVDDLEQMVLETVARHKTKSSARANNHIEEMDEIHDIREDLNGINSEDARIQYPEAQGHHSKTQQNEKSHNLENLNQSDSSIQNVDPRRVVDYTGMKILDTPDGNLQFHLPRHDPKEEMLSQNIPEPQWISPEEDLSNMSPMTREKVSKVRKVFCGTLQWYQPHPGDISKVMAQKTVKNYSTPAQRTSLTTANAMSVRSIFEQSSAPTLNKQQAKGKFADFSESDITTFGQGKSKSKSKKSVASAKPRGFFDSQTLESLGSSNYSKSRRVDRSELWQDDQQYAATLSELPHICVIGRSNVGKSSLLNAILGNGFNKLRVSKTPGRTQSVQMVNVDNHLVLVDLPGYGYALANREVRKQMESRIAEYLKSGLPRRVYILVDIRRGLGKSDISLADSLEQLGIAYQIVLTKLDRCKDIEHEAVTEQNIIEWINRRPCGYPVIIKTSSKERSGLDLFRLSIYQACGYTL